MVHDNLRDIGLPRSLIVLISKSLGNFFKNQLREDIKDEKEGFMSGLITFPL